MGFQIVDEVWFTVRIYVSDGNVRRLKKTCAEVGLGENVVLDLIKSLIGTGCHVFRDNFFTSLHLLQILHCHGLQGNGTQNKLFGLA